MLQQLLTTWVAKLVAGAVGVVCHQLFHSLAGKNPQRLDGLALQVLEIISPYRHQTRPD